MGKQKVISFLGNAECRHCHSPLYLYTGDPIKVELDKDGNVIGAMECDSNSYLKCSNCNMHYDYAKLSDGRYKVYTDWEQKMDIRKMINNIDFENINSPFIKKVY